MPSSSIRPDLGRVAALLGAPPVTRFAPSPTGYLHLGHVVNALYVWGIARALGGRVLLRVEDHDRVRCRPEFEGALVEDLEWLGFVPDEGLAPLHRQSDDSQPYEMALASLRQRHHVYACGCSRKEIGSERYPGRCRERRLPERTGRGVRLQIDEGTERVDDLLMGPLEQAPASQCGDVLIKDRDGQWTYQLAVTVDDMRQGVTLVIRGQDLVSSTGRQLRLARMLGRVEPPWFLHHPLIIGPSGEKLSKANRDTGVRELRRGGLTAADVIGRAAFAVGLIDRPGRIAADAAAALFEG